MDNLQETVTKQTETMSSMDSLEDYEKSFTTIRSGDFMTGKVIKIDETGVYVDIGFKQDGFVPFNQLSHARINHPSEVVSVGDEIPVVVLKSGGMEGEVILSSKRAQMEKAWLDVKKAYEEGREITATVVEQVKGGLLVDLGLRGFVPASQVDIRPVKDLSEYVGEALEFRVIELDEARRKVVLSRKKLMEEQKVKMREKTLESLYEGQIVKGKVARIANFGAFVDLSGVDGLVHISELSWKRIKHPGDVIKVNQDIDVMVLKIDKARERISLSYRQALPDPWANLGDSMKEGDTIKGTVTKIAKKYVFVEVADGVEGVIPIHELSDKKIMKPDMVVKEGQELEVRILELKPSARRILLSLRQAQATGDKKDVASFSHSTSSSSSSSEAATIGDILKAKMKEKADEEKAMAPADTPAPKVKEVKEEKPVKAQEPKSAPPARTVSTSSEEESDEDLFVVEKSMKNDSISEGETISGIPQIRSDEKEIHLNKISPVIPGVKPINPDKTGDE